MDLHEKLSKYYSKPPIIQHHYIIINRMAREIFAARQRLLSIHLKQLVEDRADFVVIIDD